MPRYTADQRFPWMPLESVEEWERLAEERGVSEVARSPRGFLPAYRRAGGDPNRVPMHWRRRRAGFIARHMEQARRRREDLWRVEDDTPSNRGLALIMWAYRPPLRA